MKINNIFMIFVFVSLILATMSGTPCPDTHYAAKLTSASGADICVSLSQLVYDCPFYTGSPGSYVCSGCITTMNQQSLYNSPNKACITLAQQVVNCVSYLRNSANSYSCYGCKTGTSQILNLDGTGNYVPKGCAQGLIPNCATYQQKAENDANGNVKIVCKTCNSGTSSPAAGIFNYLGNTANAGVACPLTGSIGAAATSGSAQCSQVQLIGGIYLCTLCADSANDVVMNYVAAATLRSQCVVKSTTLSYDSNCLYYDDTVTKICSVCKATNPNLVNVDDGATLATYTNCLDSVSFIPGCSTYFYSSGFICITCDSGYTLLKTGTDTVLNVASTIVGYCVRSSRYYLIPDCDIYTLPTVNDLTLRCATCTTVASQFGEKCVATSSCTAGGSTGADGTVLIKYGTVASNTQVCEALANLQYLNDNCDIYSAQPLTSSTFCASCASGSFVTTTATLGSPHPNNVCRSGTLIDNCLVYNNTDLGVCTLCKNNFAFNTATGKCKTINDYLAQVVNCTSGTVTLEKLRCGACVSAFTLNFVENKCVPSVLMCTNLSTLGVCYSCVNEYQLINNTCYKIPQNCQLLDGNAKCAACKPTFNLEASYNCIYDSNANPCPLGQYQSTKGICVIGNFVNCIKYTRTGGCDYCKSGYRVSYDGSKCEPIPTGGQVPKNVDPTCEGKSTDTVRYQRNGQGKCIGVDTQCRINNDFDGSCQACKDGQYQYRGICYIILN